MSKSERFKRPSEYTISDKQWRTLTPMDHEPDIAFQVARFVALFAAVEVNFPALLSSLIGVDRSTCEHLLSVTTDFGKRLDMIDVARLSANLNDDDQAFFDEVSSEVKTLQRRRNIYCHSLYQRTDKAGEVRLMSYRFDFRPTIEEIVTSETIKKDCLLAERLLVALWKRYEGTSYERRPLRGRGR